MSNTMRAAGVSIHKKCILFSTAIIGQHLNLFQLVETRDSLKYISKDEEVSTGEVFLLF